MVVQPIPRSGHRRWVAALPPRHQRIAHRRPPRPLHRKRPQLQHCALGGNVPRHVAGGARDAPRSGGPSSHHRGHPLPHSHRLPPSFRGTPGVQWRTGALVHWCATPDVVARDSGGATWHNTAAAGGKAYDLLFQDPEGGWGSSVRPLRGQTVCMGPTSGPRTTKKLKMT